MVTKLQGTQDAQTATMNGIETRLHEQQKFGQLLFNQMSILAQGQQKHKRVNLAMYDSLSR